MKFTDFTVVSGRGMAIMGQLAGSTTSTNVSASNFIGASDDVYANGATATVHVNRSTDNNQSGLVAGTDYYLQAVGTLSATPDSPSVLVGTARTTSSLKIKGSNAA
jgi:hypothetical protein